MGESGGMGSHLEDEEGIRKERVCDEPWLICRLVLYISICQHHVHEINREIPAW